MSKKRTVIILVLALTILSLGYVLLRPKEIKAPAQTSPAPESSSIQQPVSTASATGNYIDYSGDIIPNTAGRKVLFFHAPWCPQCRSIEKGINDQGVPAELTIIKVDYDSNQALRREYGVTLQTTFVEVDDSGQLVEKYVAYEEPTFDAVKRNFLN